MSSKSDPNNKEITKDQDKWVLLCKNSILEKTGEVEPAFHTLRHPKSDELNVYLFPSDHSVIYEVLKFEEDHRSWFVGETVQKDGGMYIPTAVDPLYLALPYLRKAAEGGKFMPVDQVIVDDEATGVNSLCTCLERSNMGCVADVKGDDDFKAVRYNEEKTLSWLKKKVERVAASLEKRGVDISSGAHAAIYQQHSTGTSASAEDHIRYAHGMVSDYIPVELSNTLKAHMGIKAPVREKPDIEEPPAKKAKKGSLEPIEDYSLSNSNAKSPAVAKQTAAQAKLSKVDKSGMKSLSSFFTKKPKKAA